MVRAGLLFASPVLAAVPLDWGKAFQSADVGSWPEVEVPYGCGTDTNMPMVADLLDKTLHFTVDLSGAGCRNVLAFQAVDAGVNDGCYCDGNSLSARDDDPYSPGNCKGPLNQNHQPCVELDFMEANKYVWATTIHAGSVGWQGGDGAGRGAGRQGIEQWQYGPGSSVIDTNKAFDVSLAFPTDGSSLLGIDVTLSQEGDSVQFRDGAGRDLHEAYESLKRGVYPGFSYWNTGEPAAWYDGNDCSESLGPGSSASFSNWRISGGSPTPSPPSPAGYTLHSHVNCYEGMGSVDLEPSGECGVLSLKECKSLCDQTEGCQAVTVAAADDGVKCCRRGSVHIAACVQGDSYYDTWTKSSMILI